MEESIHLIMKRIMSDIPIFNRYVIKTTNISKFTIELYVNNLNCNYRMKDLRDIDFHRYFKLLGLSPSDYYIDLKCIFNPSEYYETV